MSLGIAIVLHLIVFFVLLSSLLLAFGAICKVLKIKEPYRRLISKGLPLILAAFPFGGFVTVLLWENLAPAGVQFNHVFGTGIDNEVDDVMARSIATSDGREVFLRFRARGATLQTLLQQDFTLYVDGPIENDLLPMPSGDPPPTWWTPRACNQRQIYRAFSFRGWDKVVLTRCVTDNNVFVQARWVH